MGERRVERGIRPVGDRIEIRFMWQGKELRPTLDMKPTAANLKHAARLRRSILDDIRLGTFNLASYFPNYRFAHRHVATNDVSLRTVREWFEVWVALQARDLEHSTLHVYSRHMRAYWLPAFGHLRPQALTTEALLLHLASLDASGMSRKTQNNIAVPLRGVLTLASKALKIPNPAAPIENLKVQSPPPDPFTEKEVEAILTTLRKDSDVMADYFEFAFFAGLRSSEQIALLWSDVDLVESTVAVRRARVLSRDKDRTKTHVERIVELNTRARGVIDRQRPRTQLAGAHVFINPVTRRRWNDGQGQGKVWRRALRLAGVRYRPPKEARDTSVTMALAAGADPYWVARQHGHSIEVMMKDYSKWLPQADRRRNVEAVNRHLG